MVQTANMSVPKPVFIDYQDLINPEADISEAIAKGFGNTEGCLGIVVISNLPDSYKPMRQRLLTLASKFAHLPEDVKETCVTAPPYFFGWSHGKEVIEGKPDTAKGSYYNNPVYEIPPSDDPEYPTKFPAYGQPNVWPKEHLPDLQPAFMDLGGFITSVGLKLAAHCDKYVKNHHPDLPAHLIESSIKESITHKARLLHYFPMSDKEAKDAAEGKEGSWCGLHLDHSVLTGLCSAMFLDENDESMTELDSSNPKYQAAVKESGLYIKSRGDEFVKVSIPKDCLAFQLGEATQLASRGLLVATPHLVRGGSAPNVARNTFAVFLQPNVDFKLTETQTFDDFTQEIIKRHS
ncbi:hypothetical protein HDV05_003078 [Chytridiales sp. JEL 0842]|nr:hypothetical protein HDV05_003078 [Chytridiales sp. JEL 0842]